MNFSVGADEPAAKRPVVGFEEDEEEERAVDAAGVFRASGEPKKDLVIELPEHLRGRFQDDSDEEGDDDASLPSGGKEAPSYVPGLQFVGKAKLRQGTESAVKKKKTLPDAPLLALGALPATSGITDETEKFRIDLQSRPDHATQASYEAMPVEEFGKALLRGMGWREGKGVGLSNRANVEPIQYIPRPERLGLGAAPKKVAEPPEGKRRRIARPGEEPNKKNQEYVTPVTADGKVKHYVGIEHGLVAKAKLEYKAGALVGIVDGVHEGLLAKVVTVSLDRKSLQVELASGAHVTVPMPHTVLLDPALLQRTNGMAEVKRIMAAQRKVVRDSQSANGDAYDSNDGGEKKKKKKKKDKKERKQRKLETWLLPGIVVRCVSKSFQGGKLYQKKLVIMDMVTPTVANCVLLDNRSKLVESVTKDLVETALPQRGGAVCVVRGELRGQHGTLQERNSEKDRALVQMDDDSSIEKFRFDDVAQYVGNN